MNNFTTWMFVCCCRRFFLVFSRFCLFDFGKDYDLFVVLRVINRQKANSKTGKTKSRAVTRLISYASVFIAVPQLFHSDRRWQMVDNKTGCTLTYSSTILYTYWIDMINRQHHTKFVYKKISVSFPNCVHRIVIALQVVELLSRLCTDAARS